MIHTINSTPATNVRRLKMTPEGVELLLAEWAKLKADVGHRDSLHWGHNQRVLADNLTGRAADAVDASPFFRWSEAIYG